MVGRPTMSRSLLAWSWYHMSPADGPAFRLATNETGREMEPLTERQPHIEGASKPRRTAAATGVRGEELNWTAVHDRGGLDATKRIGLSALPGVCPPTGPVAYRLTFEAAVRAGALRAYRVVVAVARTQRQTDPFLDPFTGDELVLDPTQANRNVLELIGHLRRRARGSTRDVLAALESTHRPREALAHAVRTEP